MSVAKWSKNSADAKRLEELIKTGEISTETAKAVKDKYPEFQKYKTPNLNQTLKRYKTQFAPLVASASASSQPQPEIGELVSAPL